MNLLYIVYVHFQKLILTVILKPNELDVGDGQQPNQIMDNRSVLVQITNSILPFNSHLQYFCEPCLQ